MHCNRRCYGLAQRGKSFDRVSPSRKAYVEIRVDGAREYLHRYNYRQANGLEEIPEGIVIHHKDENKRINDPDNLEAKPRSEHTPHHHSKWKENGNGSGEDLDFWVSEGETSGAPDKEEYDDQIPF